jgi:hypothetical protein
VASMATANGQPAKLYRHGWNSARREHVAAMLVEVLAAGSDFILRYFFAQQ